MEEVKINILGKNVGDLCTEMYHRVNKNNPVTGLMNGVRVVMFVEEQTVDNLDNCSTIEQYMRNEE